MPAIYSHSHVVLPEEIDDLGHVNNLHYLRWMQSAAIAHSAAQGWPPERYREIGAGWVVRSHFIEYLQPAFVREDLVVRTWVSEFKKVSSLRKYQIWRPKDDAVVAVAQTNWAFLALESFTPQRIPGELAADFIAVPPDGEP